MQTRLAWMVSGALLAMLCLGACAIEETKDGPFGKTCAKLQSDGALPGCGKLANTKGCCFPDGKRGYCDNNQIKVMGCGTQQCGWNGGMYNCGASAGSDPGGTWAKSCFAYLDPPPDGSTPPPKDGAPVPPSDSNPTDSGTPPNICGKLTATGCCFPDGKHGYCDKGMIKIQTCATTLVCGWNGGKYDCGASSAADPSGILAKSCFSYFPPPPDGAPPLPEQGTPPTDGPQLPPDQKIPPPQDMPSLQDLPPPPPDQKIPPPDQKPPDQKIPPDQKPPDQKPPDQKIPPDQKPPDAKETDAKETDAKETDAKETDAKETDAKLTDAKQVDNNGGNDEAGPKEGGPREQGADQKAGDQKVADSSADAGKPDEEDTGCNCSTSASAEAPWMLGLPGLMVLVFRRRRSVR